MRGQYIFSPKVRFRGHFEVGALATESCNFPIGFSGGASINFEFGDCVSSGVSSGLRASV